MSSKRENPAAWLVARRPRLVYGHDNPSKTAAMRHRKTITATLRRALERTREQ